MAKIRKVGNKAEILKAKKERTEWEKLIDNIADKSEEELATWFNAHFSGLSTDIRQGLELIVKAVWANAKVTKKSCKKTSI
jgi:hypothetical protein